MKHAYLIMAHHRLDILRLLIESLDDERNDIYVHIDVKSNDDGNQIVTKYSRLFFIKRMNVIWGHYSQVECEYRLYEAAFGNGPYSYYHMMTGVTYPLKSQDYIHDFFEKNNGYEFIGYDDKKDFSYRVMYKGLLPSHGKRRGITGRFIKTFESYYLYFQKVFHRNLFEKYNMICKKGVVYSSVTNDFVEYVLKCEDMIKSMLKYSICGDEIFVQTLAFNDFRFRNKIYSMDNEWEGCLRVAPWKKEYEGNDPLQFTINDLDYLLASEALFAYKFDGPDGYKLIDELRIKSVNDLEIAQMRCKGDLL